MTADNQQERLDVNWIVDKPDEHHCPESSETVRPTPFPEKIQSDPCSDTGTLSEMTVRHSTSTSGQ